MKRKKLKRMITAVLVSSVFMITGCAGNNDSRDTVYEDMKEAFEKSGLETANIGLVTRTEEGDSISYGEFGSGVIFEKKNGMYYALTCAHVVSHENSQVLVFTVNTEMASEEIPGIDNMNILKPEVYDAMYEASVEFVSSRDDLAVIRFEASEDLSSAEFAEADPEKQDRIMCIGNPESEWFSASYGKVISGIEVFGDLTGFPSNAMRHTAYINVGSSGGGAYSEQMKLAGITPGASISPDGKTFNYGVLIPVSEIQLCLQEWDSSH